MPHCGGREGGGGKLKRAFREEESPHAVSLLPRSAVLFLTREGKTNWSESRREIGEIILHEMTLKTLKKMQKMIHPYFTTIRKRWRIPHLIYPTILRRPVYILVP